MDVERGNRLVKSHSWAGWLAADDTIKCLTLNCFSLNGTKVSVGDNVFRELSNLTSEELKILTVEMVNGINNCCYSAHKLSSFGFGSILDRVKAEMSVAFNSVVEFNDSRQDRLELYIFFGEKLHDEPIGPFQDDSSTESIDSMDSARFYVERLRDFFEM